MAERPADYRLVAELTVRDREMLLTYRQHVEPLKVWHVGRILGVAFQAARGAIGRPKRAGVVWVRVRGVTDGSVLLRRN